MQNSALVIEDFISGEFKNQYEYKSFSPTKINREWTWRDPQISVLLEESTKKLATLNAYTEIVPDIDQFITMTVAKEARTSNEIEGTKTEINEIFLDINDLQPERRNDWQEVQNYIKAINTAASELENLPLSLRLLRNTHKILLEKGRGATKFPGEFRTTQNWIGPSLKTAVFVPPSPIDMLDLLDDFEKFLHNREIHVPHLIRCAIGHYQFETIHPFSDGNGRIGRLFITLYLIANKHLEKPSLYLSSYLAQHRAQYFDALMRVRQSNDLIYWIKFFLQAISDIADNGIETFKKLLTLRNDIQRKLLTLGKRAQNTQKIVLKLYSLPITSAKDVETFLKVAPTSAQNYINDLVDLGILVEITGFKRNRLYAFNDYIRLF